ncbi:MAG: Crp/Fnr family transcriptional regulator [Acidobacteriota bacterium]|nr:Crp/Fnr family transcriptional regulator [Acidobacteriota bacterium]MDH3528756.1 Crp/Fnr family transcriptional regulator [Acidobacteriota bacterium]
MKEVGDLKVQHKCEQCDFREESFFCNLRDTNLKLFESLKITNAYPKGSTLFMQGQPSNGVYLLCQGKVKLSTSSKDGKVVILHIATPGEILGLSSAVSNSDHIATADVIEACQVNFVRNTDFLNFIETNSEACLRAVKQLSENYQTAYLQICSLGLSNSVADKLAMFFLSYCDTALDDHRDAHVTISYTHKEIAQMIGTSRETVTRLLKEFKEKHLISIEGSDVYIHDKQKLEASIGPRSDDEDM